MEELVINASTIEDSQCSERSSSGFLGPFSILLGDSNNNAEKAQMPITSTKENPNIVPLVDDKFVLDRFQHDVKQAKLMQRGMDKRKQQKEQQQQQHQQNHYELTKENIRLGLKGLDEAVVLRQMVGRTRDALEIN